MNKVFSKIIISCLLIGIALPGGFPVAQVNNEQSLILQENISQNTLVLDLEDAKDVKDLSVSEIDSSVIEGEVAKEITAKIESLRIEEKSSRETKSATILDPIGTGITWLKNNQNTNGSWGRVEGNEIIDTSTVISLLNYVEKGVPSIEYQKAIDWFDSTYPENSDYLAEKVISLAGAGQDVSSLAEFLASQINERDGGFGYQKDYQSDVITTTKALRAIDITNYSDSGTDPVYTLKSLLIYLLQSQNSNGGWSKVRGGQSDIKTTVLVLEALKPYQTYTLGGISQGDMIIKVRTDLGINYLKNLQSSDGKWQDIERTAKVYNVLSSYNQYPNYNQEALDYLTSNQSTDGSFANQNIYITVEVLKAIAKTDIAVTDIKNISGTIPNEPTVAEITITNIGYNASYPINFKNEPHAFHLLVDGKEVPFTYNEESPGTIIFEPNSTVKLNVILLNLAFGSHNIEFLVDYDGVEFDKANNKKSVELMFDDPVFTGPEPPAWVGVSTDVAAGNIVARWLHSTDPAKTHYYLFLGASSGNYSQYFDFEGAYNLITISGFPNDIPYYFSVASVDANNIRGDYSMETSAKAYDSPDDYKGAASFSLKDNNQNLLYNINLNFFGVGNINSTSYNPISIITYPGHYYVTATNSGYREAVQEIEIKPNETTEQTNFVLNIIDIGGGGGGGGVPEPPAPIQNLQVQAGDGQIILAWDLFNNSVGDFKNFNIYRSSSEITNVSQLTPIDISITDSNTTQFIDNTIVNGLDYYYAVTAKDLSGNENTNVVGTESVRGNSAPVVSNISTYQDKDGQIQIQYDITDEEQNNVSIEMKYWDGTVWQDALSTIGGGLQDIGTQKIIIWNPQIDYPDYDGI